MMKAHLVFFLFLASLQHISAGFGGKIVNKLTHPWLKTKVITQQLLNSSFKKYDAKEPNIYSAIRNALAYNTDFLETPMDLRRMAGECLLGIESEDDLISYTTKAGFRRFAGTSIQDRFLSRWIEFRNNGFKGYPELEVLDALVPRSSREPFPKFNDVFDRAISLFKLSKKAATVYDIYALAAAKNLGIYVISSGKVYATSEEQKDRNILVNVPDTLSDKIEILGHLNFRNELVFVFGKNMVPLDDDTVIHELKELCTLPETSTLVAFDEAINQV